MTGLSGHGAMKQFSLRALHIREEAAAIKRHGGLVRLHKDKLADGDTIYAAGATPFLIEGVPKGTVFEATPV